MQLSPSCSRVLLVALDILQISHELTLDDLARQSFSSTSDVLNQLPDVLAKMRGPATLTVRHGALLAEIQRDGIRGCRSRIIARANPELSTSAKLFEATVEALEGRHLLGGWWENQLSGYGRSLLAQPEMGEVRLQVETAVERLSAILDAITRSSRMQEPVVDLRRYAGAS